MNIKRIARAASVLCLTVALGVGLTGCTALQGMTGGIAARVNGTPITESLVTSYIQKIRTSQGLDDPEQWGMWLAQNGTTPEDVRKQVIDFYANQELLRQAARENGVSVDPKKVDEVIDKMREQYHGEEGFKQALEQAGTTEAEYRQSVEMSMLQKELMDKVTGNVTASDEEIIKAANQFKENFDHARRSSHILFDANDKAKAEEVLGKLQRGEIKFEDAAKEYSKDKTTAQRGGDVGWDKMNQFVQPYTDALSKLNDGQMTGLVTSEFGIHIIKCTGLYNAPEQITNVDQIPEDVRVGIAKTIENQKRQQAFQKWMKEFTDKAKIDINPMPANVPYNVDMAKYENEKATAPQGLGPQAQQAPQGAQGTQADGAGAGAPTQGK